MIFSRNHHFPMFSFGFPEVQAKFGHLSTGGGRLPQHQAPRAALAAHRQLAGGLGRTPPWDACGVWRCREFFIWVNYNNSLT